MGFGNVERDGSLKWTSADVDHDLKWARRDYKERNLERLGLERQIDFLHDLVEAGYDMKQHGSSAREISKMYRASQIYSAKAWLQAAREKSREYKVTIEHLVFTKKVEGAKIDEKLLKKIASAVRKDKMDRIYFERDDFDIAENISRMRADLDKVFADLNAIGTTEEEICSMLEKTPSFFR